MLDLSKIDFLSETANTFVEHTVGGRKCKFYPLSQRRVASFRGLAAKVASSIRDMLYNYSQESGAQQDRNKQEKIGSETSNYTVLPVTPQLSKLHRDFRIESMEKLVNSMDDAVMDTLGLCILDSMREDFPRDKDKPFTIADAKKLLDEIAFPTFVQCVTGVFNANMDSFGPFVKKAGKKLLNEIQGEMPATETNSSNSAE